MTDLTICYSYIRFSSVKQRQGDSLRRQQEAVADWCKRHNVRLDTSTTLHDLGTSAYTGAHRKNPDRNALASFLKLVESGKVPRGSFLVIENLDRLTREHIRPALTLLLNLIEAGVRVVQLKPVEMVYGEDVEPMALMMAIMELTRGHAESARKGQLVGDAWAEKRRRARSGEPQKESKALIGTGARVLTTRLPAWLEFDNGTASPIPARAQVVRDIFRWSAEGHGVISIVKKLTQAGVPPWGFRKRKRGDLSKPAPGVWVRTYVWKILKDRRVLGEYQPCGRGRKPEGQPVKNYYPAVVTEEEWAAARAGAAERLKKPGRVGNVVNLFAGLLKDGRDGDNWFETAQAHTRRRVLVKDGGAEGRSKYQSFPAETFESALLGMLREIDPHDVLNGDHAPDESLALAGELAEVESRIAKLEAELLKGDVAALAKVLRQLEARKGELVPLLAQAKQTALHPLSETWGQAQGLLGALDAAPDPADARLRLRSALRRMIAGIWIVPVRRRSIRLCAVQVWFAGETRRRHYLIFHERHKSNGRGKHWPERWATLSLNEALTDDRLDLRRPDHAKRAAAALESVSLKHILAQAFPSA
jgi:DNA invertase Pin-like site-specific DNA recombinase